jgi:hypothetical protein
MKIKKIVLGVCLLATVTGGAHQVFGMLQKRNPWRADLDYKERLLEYHKELGTWIDELDCMRSREECCLGNAFMFECDALFLAKSAYFNCVLAKVNFERAKNRLKAECRNKTSGIVKALMRKLKNAYGHLKKTFHQYQIYVSIARDYDKRSQQFKKNAFILRDNRIVHLRKLKDTMIRFFSEDQKMDLEEIAKWEELAKLEELAKTEEVPNIDKLNDLRVNAARVSAILIDAESVIEQEFRFIRNIDDLIQEYTVLQNFTYSYFDFCGNLLKMYSQEGIGGLPASNVQKILAAISQQLQTVVGQGRTRQDFVDGHFYFFDELHKKYSQEGIGGLSASEDQKLLATISQNSQDQQLHMVVGQGGTDMQDVIYDSFDFHDFLQKKCRKKEIGYDHKDLSPFYRQIEWMKIKIRESEELKEKAVSAMRKIYSSGDD